MMASDVEDLQHEMAALRERYAFVEQQNAKLANLFVASYRLHETLNPRDVLLVIQEIIANLVGSEQLAVFELAPGGDALELLWAFGLDEAAYSSLPAHSGVIGRSIGSGEIFIRNGSEPEGLLSHEKQLTASIPLHLNGHVVGAIAVFDLLAHKPGLTHVDEELFELLASRAATALYCSRLHAAQSATPHGERAPAR
jgi:GAF domain-containing protein